ncbi:MAG: MmcQ/YjbR family DNA-binding protein [Oryzihumus sp.]
MSPHPRYEPGDPALLARVRDLLADLPEVEEHFGVGHPQFQVRAKSLAMFMPEHHGVAWDAVWVKATTEVQQDLIARDGRRWFRPPYVGPRGWVGARLTAFDGDGDPAWDDLGELLESAWRSVAPKRVIAAHDGSG